MKVWVLVWGGGDEPESPAIELFQSKGRALEQARKYINEFSDDHEEVIDDDGNTDDGEAWVEAKLNELATEGHAWELRDTWLTLEETVVRP